MNRTSTRGELNPDPTVRRTGIRSGCAWVLSRGLDVGPERVEVVEAHDVLARLGRVVDLELEGVADVVLQVVVGVEPPDLLGQERDDAGNRHALHEVVGGDRRGRA